MIGSRWMRTAAWTAAAGALVLAGAVAEGKIKVKLAKNLKDYHVERVAILGLANTAGDVEADQIGTMLVHALSHTEYYHITLAGDFAQDAVRTGVETEHGRMLSTWLKKRKMDEQIVQKVLEATGYDAVIAAEVSRWEEVAIDPLQEGTSDTSVGVLVEMYARDGTLLWSAKESITEHSRPYLPDFNLRGTESGRAVTTSRGAVPEPPEVKRVAEKLAEAVMSTIPDVKQKDREKTVPEGTAAPDSAGMQD